MNHPLFDPINIYFKSLEIRTLRSDDIQGLASILCQDQTIYQDKYQLNTFEKSAKWLEELIIEYKGTTSHPLVILKNGEIAGVTSFHTFSKNHKRVTMGGTWILANYRQTNVNSEMKLWALSYLLEELRLNRVEFCVDEKNYASQMAMIRLGLQFEGDRQCFYTSTSGDVSSAKIYSCTTNHWPEVKLRIQQLLAPQNSNLKLFGIPECVESDRIYFRRYRLSDANSLFDLIVNNRNILKDSFPNQSKWRTIEETKQGIAKWSHQWAQKNTFFWGVFDTKTSQLIGQAHMKSIDWVQGSADIGYYLDSHFHHKGLGKLSIQILENIAKDLQLHRLVARVFLENKASINALKSCNFSQEGTLCNAFRNSTGQLQDTHLMGKLIQ